MAIARKGNEFLLDPLIGGLLSPLPNTEATAAICGHPYCLLEHRARDSSYVAYREAESDLALVVFSWTVSTTGAGFCWAFAPHSKVSRARAAVLSVSCSRQAPETPRNDVHTRRKQAMQILPPPCHAHGTGPAATFWLCRSSSGVSRCRVAAGMKGSTA